MMINGVWFDNITCPRCRKRHPENITCKYAKSVADENKEEREKERERQGLEDLLAAEGGECAAQAPAAWLTRSRRGGAIYSTAHDQQQDAYDDAHAERIAGVDAVEVLPLYLDLRGNGEKGVCEVPPDAGYPWFGCGECDTTFGCYEGEARCIRLLPLTAQEPVAKLHDETIGEIAQIAGLIDAGETGQAYDICKGLAEYHHQEAASIRRKEKVG